MTARILDGKALAAKLRAETAAKVKARLAARLQVPGLATVLVGDDSSSALYFKNKRKACEEAGIQSFGFELPRETTETELLETISKLNERKDVHGILVQLPLPNQIDRSEVAQAVDVRKDVDCLHPENVGLSAQRGGTPRFVPCTPAGIMRLLTEAGAKLSGAHAVVLGRSNIVGMPLALLLVQADATVTIGHSKTRDLAALCREADILVAAVGKAELVRADWVKPGAVVIDVGVNRVDDPAAKSGYRVVGDVAFDEVSRVAGALSPVPGGVGPMTIAMLLENTLHAAELAD